MLILLFSLCLLLSVFTFSSSILAFFSVSSCRLLHIFFISFGIYRGFHHPPVTLLLLFFARFFLYPFSRYLPAPASLNTSAINVSASLPCSSSLSLLSSSPLSSGSLNISIHPTFSSRSSSLFSISFSGVRFPTSVSSRYFRIGLVQSLSANRYFRS
jgi:hypothetical protein